MLVHIKVVYDYFDYLFFFQSQTAYKALSFNISIYFTISAWSSNNINLGEKCEYNFPIVPNTQPLIELYHLVGFKDKFI